MLNTAVLVLNRHYQPIHITSVKRAFSLLYQGAARALDAEYRLYDFFSWAELSADRDNGIATSHRLIRVPRVLVLSAFELLPQGKVRLSRLNVYARDRDTCQYCGRMYSRPDLNLDHVVPRSQGGRTRWENVVCSCVKCNMRKGGRTPEQAGMRLLKEPVKPRWTPIFRGAHMRQSYREWLPFLSMADAAYWNVELRDDE